MSLCGCAGLRMKVKVMERVKVRRGKDQGKSEGDSESGGEFTLPNWPRRLPTLDID